MGKVNIKQRGFHLLAIHESNVQHMYSSPSLFPWLLDYFYYLVPRTNRHKCSSRNYRALQPGGSVLITNTAAEIAEKDRDTGRNGKVQVRKKKQSMKGKAKKEQRGTHRRGREQ